MMTTLRPFRQIACLNTGDGIKPTTLVQYCGHDKINTRKAGDARPVPASLPKLCSAHRTKHKAKKTYDWDEKSFLAALSPLVEVNRNVSVVRVSKRSSGGYGRRSRGTEVRAWASISLPGFLPCTVHPQFQPQTLHLPA